MPGLLRVNRTLNLEQSKPVDNSPAKFPSHIIRTTLQMTGILLALCGIILGLDALGLWFKGITIWTHFSSNWGNLASIMGLLVSVLGLAFAIALAKEAVTAARAAAQAAREAKESVYNFDSIVQLTKANTLLNQIVANHRDKAWDRLPALYAEVRSLLVTLTSKGSRLNELQRTSVSAVMLMLNDADEDIENFLPGAKRGAAPSKSGEILSLLKNQSDKLIQLQSDLRAVQGE